MANQVPVVDYLRLGPRPHLSAHRCTGCGALHLDRRNRCPRCGGAGFEDHDLADEGIVRSWTITHRAGPGIAVPFVSVLVDLDGGGVVKANLLGVEPEPGNVRAGMRVRLDTFVAGVDEVGTEAVAFGFAPV